MPPYCRVAEPSALRKGLENQALLVERDTNPRIPDGKVQEAAGCPFLVLSLRVAFWGSCHLDLNHHLPVGSEFDRIAHEVHQDLTQAPRIALQGIRDVWLHAIG